MGVRDTSLCVQEEVTHKLGLLGHVGVSWGGEGRESKERASVKGHKAPRTLTELCRGLWKGKREWDRGGWRSEQRDLCPAGVWTVT